MTRRATAVILALLPSCMWVPDAGVQAYDRGLVPAAGRASLEAGKLTRADVVCSLGEPDWISADETKLAYRIQRIHSYFWVYLIGGLGVMHFGVLETELFWFDRDGRLLRHRQVVGQDIPGGGDGGPGPLVLASEIDDARMTALFDAHAK